MSFSEEKNCGGNISALMRFSGTEKTTVRSGVELFCFQHCLCTIFEHTKAVSVFFTWHEDTPIPVNFMLALSMSTFIYIVMIHNASPGFTNHWYEGVRNFMVLLYYQHSETIQVAARLETFLSLPLLPEDILPIHPTSSSA